MQDRNKKLKDRVINCREKLSNLEIKKPLVKFARKYPRYVKGSTSKEKEKSKTRLRNLFYCKAFDEDFTKHLEVFVEITKTNN
ncbi:hypothetical protein M1M25_gp023 [Tenacibaculum phage Gundel_1]|uniref:Uncharacterized protein n=1 Tax=Tenacibaculum phage Gundel_1 TaxID=2745672 RepID=A0A8E4ZGG2_9CAUD|nr:hypothetical protein M1M25_gp023 [Tenacibaculum phage Gundel_1]QQV91454.1 hypothetical protein Gundel1_23 [Tenacibaculum phage Gundel_1]